MDRPELVLRNAYVASEGAVVDVAIAGGHVAAVAPDLPERADAEIDVDGDLVSPGLVDAHVHLDMAFSAAGDRVPRHNDGPFDRERSIERTGEYFERTPADDLESRIYEAATRAITNGAVHLRTHAYVDSSVGTKVVEALLSVRDALADALDVQIVAFPQRGCLRDPGSKAVLHEALDLGADVVGGIDPASINGGIERTIKTWFDVATEHDAPVDAHLHDQGTLGLYTLARLAEHAVERGYDGRVTASHCFALADAATRTEDHPTFAGWTLAPTLERLAAADLDVVTCYQSMRPGTPIRQLHEAGLTVAHGTDQVRDLWWPHGNADPLEAMLVASLKLDSSGAYATNQGLAHLWRTITTDGARVLGLGESYGIEPGTPADLVVHGATSPQWAIVERPTPRYVIKDGTVVATDGALESTTPS